MISFVKAVSTLSHQFGRRFEDRRRVDCLVYVDFGADNGALINDLGEGGLGFQSIAPVSINLALPLKFKLPGDANPIEGYAEVAWVNESGKGGGLRFVSLSADACAQIREWTGAIAAPRPRALRAPNGRASNSAPTGANSVQQSTTPEPTAPEPTKREDVPAQISEALARAESAQVADPCPEISGAPSADAAEPSALPGASLVPESSVPVLPAADLTETFALRVDSAPSAVPSILATGAPESASPHEPERKIDDGVEATASQVADPCPEISDAPSADAAEPSALPGASLVPESSVPVLPAADLTETFALRVDSASSAVPSILATGAPESASPHEPERKIDDGVEATASVDSTTLTCETPKTVRTKPNLAPPVAPFGFSTQAPATPGWATRVPAPDSRNSVSVQKGQRRSTPSKPESPLPPANHHDLSGRGLRHVSASAEWETLPPARGDEFRSKWMLAPWPLKFWIGAATGVCLVLAVFAGMSVRMWVQATEGARSGGSSLASVSAFQVEVVDLSNRRWTLRSAGEAGSPFNDTSSHPERPPEASSAGRNKSAKSSHLSDFQNYNNTIAPPQGKN